MAVLYIHIITQDVCTLFQRSGAKFPTFVAH